MAEAKFLPYNWHPAFDNIGVTRFFIYHHKDPKTAPAFIQHNSSLLYFSTIEDARKFCDLLNCGSVSLTYSSPKPTTKPKKKTK
jgi:hypothetical protein